MIHPFCFIDGRVAETSGASFALSDLGILRSFGVFDYFRTYNSAPFLLDHHIGRFIASAKALEIEIAGGAESIRRAVLETLAANAAVLPENSEYGVRLVATGGPSDDGFQRTGGSTFAILVETPPAYDGAEIRRGMVLLTCEFLRELPTVKTTNYLNSVRMQPALRAAGAGEVLYVWKGAVLEASRSNIFAFLGDTLVTPKDDVLIGNTRRVVIELAQKFFAVEERRLEVEELARADEVFITGTGKRIAPVVRIDQRVYGAGAVGPRALKLIEAFDELVAEFRG